MMSLMGLIRSAPVEAECFCVRLTARIWRDYGSSGFLPSSMIASELKRLLIMHFKFGIWKPSRQRRNLYTSCVTGLPLFSQFNGLRPGASIESRGVTTLILGGDRTIINGSHSARAVQQKGISPMRFARLIRMTLGVHTNGSCH